MDGLPLEPKTIKQQNLQQKQSKFPRMFPRTIYQKKEQKDKLSVKSLSWNTIKSPTKTLSVEQPSTTNKLDMAQDMEVEVEVEGVSHPMEDLFYVAEDEADQGLQQLQTATIVYTTPITTNSNQTNNKPVINYGDNYTSTVQQPTRFSTIYVKQQQI
ncbi:hypothetical protein G6F56_008759 [Rhizopus delemar]|nr:hypothetical protein G6F56_008759 [Rhizopus delemar]